MRKPAFLILAVALSAPALAWVPKLEETTARNVIDGAYGRRDPVPTFQTVDLNVKDGQFVAGEKAVQVFDGGEKCVADWLAAPADFGKGSRPASVIVSGQADQLYFQAVEARDSFKNLSVQDALNAFGSGFLPNAANNYGQLKTVAKTEATTTGKTTTSPATVTTAPAPVKTPAMADGLLRVDVNVRGLPSEKARDAYLVFLKGADGKPVKWVRKSFVNDFKQDAGKWSGTLVYYFEPLKAGLGASDRVELLIRTEADTSCAYSVGLDLGSFQ